MYKYIERRRSTLLGEILTLGLRCYKSIKDIEHSIKRNSCLWESKKYLHIKYLLHLLVTLELRCFILILTITKMWLFYRTRWNIEVINENKYLGCTRCSITEDKITKLLHKYFGVLGHLWELHSTEMWLIRLR